MVDDESQVHKGNELLHYIGAGFFIECLHLHARHLIVNLKISLTCSLKMRRVVWSVSIECCRQNGRGQTRSLVRRCMYTHPCASLSTSPFVLRCFVHMGIIWCTEPRASSLISGLGRPFHWLAVFLYTQCTCV